MPSKERLSRLRTGLCIPAHPLALDANRRLDVRRQRALTRYYMAAGAGGMAIGVHTTQFAIRDPGIGLFEPVLSLAVEEMRRNECDPVRIGGVCGNTRQAVSEAELLYDLGYDAALLSMSAMPNASEDDLIQHARAVGEVMPLFGFYLQPAVGGRVLPFSFWRRFVEIEAVVAIKVAPFNRYHTLDVMHAVAQSQRDDIAMYTGNDDNIIADLITPYTLNNRTIRFVGGLLGHWSVWTQKAAVLLRRCQQEAASTEWLRHNVAVTDCNAAFFDAINGFRGCIAGLHEVLRRQGLFENIYCLDPNEGLSPGQAEQIDRVYKAYPELNDDAFVAQHLDEWLR
ncbi:MAG: dihydrodipicolinate synthase family protein [Pirellulaceae bacterium]